MRKKLQQFSLCAQCRKTIPDSDAHLTESGHTQTYSLAEYLQTCRNYWFKKISDPLISIKIIWCPDCGSYMEEPRGEMHITHECPFNGKFREYVDIKTALDYGKDYYDPEIQGWK